MSDINLKTEIGHVSSYTKFIFCIDLIAGGVNKIKAVTKGPLGGLQISNTRGPQVTWFQNDSRKSEMKFV